MEAEEGDKLKQEDLFSPVAVLKIICLIFM